MASQVRQTNDLPSRTLWEILYGSEEILAPFNKNSTRREIEETLNKLHREASQGNTASQTLETILESRKEMLRKIIAYIDVEASPRNLTWQFMSDLCDDFSLNIEFVIYKMPDPGYIGMGKWEDVNRNLSKASSALRAALDEFESQDEIVDEQASINEKYNMYTALHTATECFEEGLSNWGARLVQSNEDTMDLAGYLEASSARLQEQTQTIKNIHDNLRFVGSKLWEELKLFDFELLLRKQILTTLLAIPAPTMPADKASQELITRSKLHSYISYKSDIIKNVRLAKIALNQALDKYELIKPLRKVKRGDLEDHINHCTTPLDKAIQMLQEKP